MGELTTELKIPAEAGYIPVAKRVAASLGSKLGFNLEELDVRLLFREPKSAAAGVIEQVAQGSLMRVILPWMIGKAFDRLSDPTFIDKLGQEVKLPVPKPFQPILFTMSKGKLFDRISLQQSLEPSTNSLRQAGQNLSASLEPVTSSARLARTRR